MRGARAASPRWRPALVALAVVAPVYIAGYIWTVRTRPLFAPDTRYYAAMSMWFSGTSQEDAARRVGAYTETLGYATPDASVLFHLGLVQPRVVLPFLSVPFVKLWGIDGLAVVPGIALAVVVALMTVTLTRRYGAGPAMVAMVLVAGSTQIVFFGAAMLTEGLSALWTALTLVVSWRYLRDPRPRDLMLVVLLTLLSAFTRQATLILAGAFVSAWFFGLVLRRPERWGRLALAVSVTSVATQLVQSWLFPFSQANQFEYKTGTDSLGEALLASPGLAWDIVRLDFLNAVATDRAQLALVLVATVSMIVLWRRSESHLMLGALIGIGIYNVTNGTPVGFRYAMPGLVFFAVSVAALAACAGPLSAAHGGPRPTPGRRQATTAAGAVQPSPEPPDEKTEALSS